MSSSVIFGWGAPPLKEQFPELSERDADHFDKDNDAIIRAHVRGYLTDRQRDAAIKKCTRAIERAILKARAALNAGGE